MSERWNRSIVLLRVAAGVLLLAGGGRLQAVGTWSVLAPPYLPDLFPDRAALSDLSVDSRGNLYMLDHAYRRILKRDAEGLWSILPLSGPAADPAFDPFTLAVDRAGNLYVGEYPDLWIPRSRVLKRDPGGHWTVVATVGNGPGQVYRLTALATDGAGNLYVADDGSPTGENVSRVQKRDPRGNWTVLTVCVTDLGPDAALVPPVGPRGLAADGAGHLYVMEGPDENGVNRLVRLDAAGNCTVLNPPEGTFGDFVDMAADLAGNLYVAANGRIRKRDAAGNWTEPIPQGWEAYAISIAADDAGGLYVADVDYRHIGLLKRDDRGEWSRLTPEPPPGTVVSPEGVALDRAGNLYVADAGNLRVQQRDPQGNWTTLTTVGTGPGQVLSPRGLAVDDAGTLYVAESGRNPRLQQRDPAGHWTVLATAGLGLGQIAGLAAVASDGDGTLYVADFDGGSNGRIQKRDPAGHWTEIATAGNGPGQVIYPWSLAIDRAGNLYVADRAGRSMNIDRRGRIQKRDREGNWTELAAYGNTTGRVHDPGGLAVDGAGNLYVSDFTVIGDQGRSRLQKRAADGTWTDLGPKGVVIDFTDYGFGLAVDGKGNVYVTDGFGAEGRVQMRDAAGNMTTLTASGSVMHVGQVRFPRSVAVDRADHVYVTDDGGATGRVQMRDAAGAWTEIASSGTHPGQVHFPSALAVNDAGSLYVSDFGSASGNGSVAGRVQKRDTAGTWTVLATAGTGLGQINGPMAVASDGGGNLYVADRGRTGKNGAAGRVQKRDAQGNWTEIAAAGTASGRVDDPLSLVVDRAGNLYVADRGGTSEEGSAWIRIQKRDPEGNWTEIATAGSSPGPPDYYYPATVMTVDGAGNLYVADVGNHRVQKRDAKGVWTGLTVWGSAVGQVFYPRGLAVDDAGNLYVADSGNNRVQQYTVTGGDLLAGDLDGDGKIAPTDALLTARAVIGSFTPTPDQAAAADVNRDGRVEIADVGLILWVAVGVLSRFP